MSPSWESIVCGDSPDSRNLGWLQGEVEVLQLCGSRLSVGPWLKQKIGSQLFLKAYFVINGRFINRQKTKRIRHFSAAMVIAYVHPQSCNAWLSTCWHSILRSRYNSWVRKDCPNFQRIRVRWKTGVKARKRLPLLNAA